MGSLKLGEAEIDLFQCPPAMLVLVCGNAASEPDSDVTGTWPCSSIILEQNIYLVVMFTTSTMLGHSLSRWHPW